MGADCSFKPFHKSIVPAIGAAKTEGVLKRLTCLIKHTRFPNENGESADVIADAIMRRADKLKLSVRDNYFAKIANRLRTGNIGTRPLHATIAETIGHVPTSVPPDALEQMYALGNLIMTTRIPTDRPAVRRAFSKKANRIGLCTSNPGFCNNVWSSLDAQRNLDEAEMKKAA